MEEFDPADEAERAIANALRELQPASGDLSSERLWYRAGLAAGRQHVNAWRAATVVAAIVAALSLQYSVQTPMAIAPAPRRYVRLQAPAIPPVAPAPVISTPGSGNYLALRNDLLEKGLDALPAEAPHPLPALWDDRNLGRNLSWGIAAHFNERGF